MKKAVLLSACLTATVVCVQPVLADPIEKAISARRGYMQVIGFNAGPLFGMAKGSVAYDAKKAQAHADNLKAIASITTDGMWPKGSENGGTYKGKTRALPAIWETNPKFVEADNAWKAAVMELANDAGKGLDALKAKVTELGKSCGGCHKPFRAKDF